MELVQYRCSGDYCAREPAWLSPSVSCQAWKRYRGWCTVCGVVDLRIMEFIAVVSSELLWAMVMLVERDEREKACGS